MAKKKATEMVEELSEMEIVEVKEIEANKKRLTRENMISSGSSLLNLHLTGSVYGAFITGKIYHIVGTSTSGKTMVCLHTIANIVMDEKYDDYDIIMDEPEGGNDVDMEEMFGPVTASRIKAPRYDEETGDPIHSKTAEDFYDNLTRLKNEGKKFFYFLDSMDGLTSEADIKKIEENLKLRDAGKDAGGSFGMGKASVNSKRLGVEKSTLGHTGNTLFIISQERDDISFGAPMGAKSYSGGKALKFYATCQIWFRHKKELTKTIKGKPRPVGNKAVMYLPKNRLTGQKHKNIPLTISFNDGIDDIMDMLEFLIDESVLKKGTKINAEKLFGDGVNFTLEKLGNWVNDNDKEEILMEAVQAHYDEIQQLIKNKTSRKKKYK